MKHYYNLKVRTKLIISFIIIALICGAMGAYSIVNINNINNNDTELYEKMTVPLAEIGQISTEFQMIRSDSRDLIILTSDAEMQKIVDDIKLRRSNLDKLFFSFEKTIISDKVREEYMKLLEADVNYDKAVDKVMTLALANKNAEAYTVLMKEGSPAARAQEQIINNIMTMKVEAARNKSDSNDVSARNATLTMIGIMILVIILSIAIGLFISSLISRPLVKAMNMIREMSKGHFDQRLNMDAEDEIGQMAKTMDEFADNLQINVIGLMNKISSGDVSMDIVVKDDKDEITPAMKNTVDTIRELNDSVQNLISAITEGKLDVRGNSNGYTGSWKELILGINSLVDAFVAPINMTAEYVERISKGDIPSKITETYYGDFNEIKNSINGCIEVLNNLQNETEGLINASRDGKLDIRGNAASYFGNWGVLVNGINDLIDAFVAPINLTAEYVERISKGDIPAKITDTYYGDFNEIKNNINNCIDTMNGLLNETNKLINAANEGQIGVRGNAAVFTGDWGKLVNGMNDLMDAFVRPINLTSDYIDRISKGDIPEKITEKYHGDFNEIINNLNQCINIMNGMVSETDKLIQAAQNGQLDVRANISGFTGSWEVLISGINELVEAVVRPINEVTAVMNEISEGNLKVSVKGDYKGEFGVLSNAVNNTARDLNSVVVDISGIIGQISEGNLTLASVREYRGDFVSISDSLRNILDSLNNVLGDINEASDQVSIGSKQVSDGSQALSQGATEQASSIEELTASVNEVAAKTKENASSANEANTLTLDVKQNAEQGNRHMAEMLQAMDDINLSSNNISRIIKVIDDIAFQTNILALNAAVEAARAGQHGKGFAVVAEEVRTLAARSAEAAKETTDLIQGSITKSSKGTEIANNTAKALYEIVSGVTKTADIIGEIARSSNEQAMGIAQINTGLTQVSQVVQNNAATAEESAASSEELSGQAEILKEMVGKFKLRGTVKNLSSFDTKRIESKNYKQEQVTAKIDLGELSQDKY